MSAFMHLWWAATCGFGAGTVFMWFCSKGYVHELVVYVSVPIIASLIIAIGVYAL